MSEPYDGPWCGVAVATYFPLPGICRTFASISGDVWWCRRVLPLSSRGSRPSGKVVQAWCAWLWPRST